MHHDGDDGKHGKRFRLKVRHVVLGIFAVLVLAGLLRMAILSSGANRRIGGAARRGTADEPGRTVSPQQAAHGNGQRSPFL